jgi:Bacterial SH3 domain
MIKRNDGDPGEPSPGLAKLIAPEYTAAFERWSKLSAQFDAFNNSAWGRSLKQMEWLNLPALKMARLNLPVIQGLKPSVLERFTAPMTDIQARLLGPSLRVQERLLAPFLRMQERINSPAMRMMARFESPLKQMQIRLDNPALDAMKAARLWADSSLYAPRWAAQGSALESLKLFQRAAEQAAALAQVDVGELATAVNESLGSVPLPDAAQVPESTSAPAMSSLEDAWKALPFPVQLFVYLLWYLLLIPLAASYVQRWTKSSPESRPEIIVNVNETLGDDFSRNLRCVRGAGINIRESPSKTAPIIGRLGRSQAVAVIETEGSFSRIQYHDPVSGEIREGWAASGYLVGTTC